MAVCVGPGRKPRRPVFSQRGSYKDPHFRLSILDTLYTCFSICSLPSFQGLNNMNSASLAASFVLVLPHPVPVSMSVINSIQEVTGKRVHCVMS